MSGQTIGSRVRQLRNEAKMTQVELAGCAGCSSQVISNIERDYTRATPEILTKIAKHFNVPADYLMSQSDARWMAELPYSRTDNFPQRLNNRMRQLQLPVSDLAHAINIEENVCKDILSGKARPSIDALARIACALDTTIDYLIGNSDYAIAVSNEDEEDILKYFREMDKSHRRRFMGLLEEMMEK